MLRASLLLAATLMAAPAFAQSANSARPTDCMVRMNAAPTSWMISGYDPYGGSLPEGTFSVTYINDGGSECRFAPLFDLTQPPFGLSKGTRASASAMRSSTSPIRRM